MNTIPTLTRRFNVLPLTKVRLKSEIPDKKNRDMKYLKLVYCSC